VLAPRLDYRSGRPLPGWQRHDREASYPVIRVRRLRTNLAPRCHGLTTRALAWLDDAALRAALTLRLAWLILHRGIGAVCIGELHANGWILALLRLFPWVVRAVYVHGEEIANRNDYDKDGSRRRCALLAAAQRIVVVSAFTETLVRAHLGEAAKPRLVLIENGVDTARFRARARDPALLARYGLQGCFVFVSVCRLLETKGIDQAIRAFRQVAPRHHDVRFLVVGGGADQTRLAAIAAQCGVADKVVFAGVVANSELTAHCALGDVFAMPNRSLPNGDTEGFGLVFLEANACGVPVIAGDEGGSRDAVRHGESGLRVDGRSVAAIAAAMLDLYDSQPTRDRLRTGGLVRAAASSWGDKASQFVAALAASPGSISLAAKAAP